MLTNINGKPENNQRALMEHQMRLVEGRWKGHVQAIMEGFSARHGRQPDEWVLRNTAQVLENTNNFIQSMDEASRNSALGTFIDYGLDVVTGVAPNLIANELCSVQAINARSASIFFLDFVYGTNKGNISAATAFRTPESGSLDSKYYSSERIEHETLGTGNGSATTFTTTLAYYPVRQIASVMKIYDDGSEVGAVDAAGTFTGAALTTGSCSLDFTTGDITVVFASAPTNGHLITFTYEYDMFESTVGVPAVEISMREKTIEARPRKLRAQWLLDTAYAYGKEHNRDLDADIMMAMGTEIKHEIDGHLIHLMYSSAGLTGYSFNSDHDYDPTNSYYGVKAHYESFCDVLNEAANDIFKASKRTSPNWLVVGKNGAIVVEGMGGDKFKPATDLGRTVNGPHFIGTLMGKYRVYKNPFFGDTAWLLGCKGTNYLDAGFIYAPFMPVVATPAVMLDDFLSRRGVATSAGYLMNDSNLFAKGTVTRS